MLPMLLAGGGALAGGLGALWGGNSQASAARDIANKLQTAWQPINTATGYGTANFNPDTGMFSTSLTGPTADWQSKLFDMATASPTQSGQDFLTQGAGMISNYANAPTVDVNQMAQNQYGLLSGMAAPGERQAAGNLFASLAARGMLGASGGAGAMGALETSQGMADLARQAQAVQQAQQAASLQNQINQGMLTGGMNLTNLGQGLNQQEFLNALNAGNTATGLFGLENQVGQTAQGLGANRANAVAASAPYLMQANQNPLAAFLGGAGQGMLGAGIQGMMNPTPTPTYNATPWNPNLYGPSVTYGMGPADINTTYQNLIPSSGMLRP